MTSLAHQAIAAPRPRDTVWARPDASTRVVREIALLPPVNVVDDARAAAFAERQIERAFCPRTPQIWLLANDARARLVRNTRHPYSELDSLARQIWVEGHIDSIAARDVARQLGVESVLCARVNRWEHLERWSAERIRAFVGMQAAIVDSNGLLLWTIAGENAARTTHAQQTALAEGSRDGKITDWCVTLGNAVRISAPDFAAATSEMMERWAKEYPLKRR